MKLYAVCVKARLDIGGQLYNERWVPISKVAHLPLEERFAFKYAPAVYTNKKNADKMLKRMLGAFRRHDYQIVEFDSDFVDLPHG